MANLSWLHFTITLWLRCILCYGARVTTEQIIGLSVTLVVMLIGLVGSVVPVLPGTPVVLIAAIGHRLYFGDASVSNLFLVALLVMTGLSLLLDFLASVIGAKKFGATWRGMVGAVLGGIVGLFFALPGIVAGPFVGAMLLEMSGGKEFKVALRAGTGAVLGLLLGTVAKFGICVVMIALFATNTIYRTLNQPQPAPTQLAQAPTCLVEKHFVPAMMRAHERFEAPTHHR